MENLPNKKYDILYADPCWDYKGQTQHSKVKESGGAISHYPTMKLKDLINGDINKITKENALLFMWTSSPHLDQAIQLGASWGFAYITIGFIWDKQKVNPGYYTMSSCEICLIFKKGKIPTPRGSRNERQFLSEMRTNHSKKPDEIRDRINRMFPTQDKIELFARTRIDGWDCWGNEVN